MRRVGYDRRMEVALNGKETDQRVKGFRRARAGGGHSRKRVTRNKERGRIRLRHWMRRRLAAEQSLAHQFPESNSQASFDLLSVAQWFRTDHA